LIAISAAYLFEQFETLLAHLSSGNT